MQKTLLTLALLLPAPLAYGQDHIGHDAEQCPNKPGPCPNKPKPEPAPEPAPPHKPKPKPSPWPDLSEYEDLITWAVIAGAAGLVLYALVGQQRKPTQ